MKQHFYERYALIIIVLVGCLFPITVGGALLALQSNRNDVEDWLPESFPETRDYKQFQRYFADEMFVLLSWEGCTLDDPRLAQFAERVKPRRAQTGQPDYFSKVLTGASKVEEMIQPPTSLPEDTAIERLTGSLIGLDGRQTCAVLTLSAYGRQHLHAAIDRIYEVAQVCGVPRSAIRMGGPPVDNVAIDLEGERMLVTLFALSGAVGIALGWWFLRNPRLTLMVVIGGAYSAALCLAIVRFTGTTMNSILLTMPAVVYTSGLAAAIHIVNYYRHARTKEGVESAPLAGLKLAWLPCLLSAGTTSLGLISLYTSAIVPIKQFGLYTAVGVMMAVGLMFLYLPAALYLWPPPFGDALEGRHEHAPGVQAMKHRRRMRGLARLIIARPWAIWAAFVAIVAFCGAGLTKARTTVDIMSLFSPDAQIIHHYQWLEDKIGPLVPMEIVVRMERDAPLTIIERLELLSRVQRRLGDKSQFPEVGSTMSAATFAPDMRAGRGLLGRRWRYIVNRRLEAHLQDFVEGGYLAIDQQTHDQLWRINVRVAALQQIDYGEFNEHIKAFVDPLLQGTPGLKNVTYTGLTTVVYRTERVLLEGLRESFFVAFLMIGGMMAAVFRNLLAGLYTMLPNVWPVAVVFGAMSWLGIKLDIGTMMTASVAMGVCVDDTVHFATWFRRALALGLTRREAVVMAFENSAGAIYQSTVIVALGLVTFGLSSFMPTQRFGFLMCTLLFFGLLADLVLTPAMLAGAIGRFFSRAMPKPTQIDAQDSPEQRAETLAGETPATQMADEAAAGRGR